MVSFLVCLLIGAAARAEAPVAADAPSKVSHALEKALGKPLRVAGEAGFVEGRLLETSAQFLTLDAGVSESRRAQFQLSSVRELYVRGRHAGTGAVIGAVPGFLAGIILGTYVCSFAEYSATASCLPLGVLAGVGGGLVAAGLGAIIGSLIPSWDKVYARVLDGPLLLPPLRAPEEAWVESAEGHSPSATGQLGLFVSNVLTIDEPADALGLGARVEALVQLSPHVALGPEVAFHHLFESLDRQPLNAALFSFGALMRATPRPAVLTPSLLVGLSAHTAGQPVTYSVGAGLDWRPAHGATFALELRWHQFNVPWKDGRQLTLGFGTRFFL
ncbi:hypothetical protein STIAU_0845 [Stigmatella aurantiaca DW4/3-1]|nr:hypothetical protein STIAU_0845 [Stigmatella aurantiaca DW4/3-1]